MTRATVTEELLEARLRDAVADPSRREEFLRLLLEARVWVLGTTGRPGGGDVQLAPGERVEVTTFAKPDGSTYVPFFTSREALTRAVREATPCFAIPTRALFEMTRGTPLVLNPGSVGKEFLPAEVADLLAHGPGGRVTQRQLPAGAQMLVAQPSERPVAMLDALARLFARQPRVSRAFLALVHVPSVEPRARLVIGLEVDGGEHESIVRAAGPIADAHAGVGRVDFVLLRDEKDGLTRYMLEQTKPFYRRR